MAPSLEHPALITRTAMMSLSTSRISKSRTGAPARYFATSFEAKTGKKERVVILGSGWAGYAFARTLDPARYERVVVSPRSYFVFTPLLASTAVGTLEFRTTLESVRRLGGSVEFRQGWADDVDFARRVVRVEENHADGLASRAMPPPPPPAQKDKSGGGKEEEGEEEEGGVQARPLQVPKGPVTEVAYDKLVIAVGAYSQTFGIEGVRQHAHFLRDIGDARRIRLRVLSLFEQCTSPAMSDESRRNLLHFAIVGGGPTGIEYAAELHDLVRDDLSRIYPSLLPFVRITVYDIAPKILPMFDQTLASYAMGLFRRQGIDVRTGHSIQHVRPDAETGGLRLGIKTKEQEEDGRGRGRGHDGDGGSGGGGGGAQGKQQDHEAEVGAGIVVWSTGLMQNPLVEKLVRKSVAVSAPVPRVGVQKGEETARAFRLERDRRTGGIIVDERFRARLIDAATLQGDDNNNNNHNHNHNSTASPSATSPPTPDTGSTGPQQTQVLHDVFVIGDCAVIDSQPTLPKTAQVASQEAAYLARALNKGTPLEDYKPFRFRNLGTMTYLGNWKAIHQSSADHLTGWAAWVLWRTAYLTRSMSWKNKVLVPVYWFVSWVFGRDISRF